MRFREFSSCVAQQPANEPVLEPHIINGITEDIVAGLSASRWLIVYDIGTSFSLSGSTEAPAELGSQLGANYVCTDVYVAAPPRSKRRSFW